MQSRFGSLLPRVFALLLMSALSVTASAAPEQINWDALTWLPAGPTNLSETYTIGLHDVVVTIGGNTADLDAAGSPVSPEINTQNEGALAPVQNSLHIATNYVDMSNPEVSVTLDFSDYPGGVSNISFTLFDIDADATFTDEAEVTATLIGGGTVDPTTLTPSSANAVLDSNSIQGTGPSPSSGAGSGAANAFFAFSQSGITSITVVYRNNIAAANPGFQWMNFHDISFDAPRADIAVNKSVDNPAANVGDTVVFTVTATNNGTDAVNFVNILDQLPAGFTYVSDTGGGTYNNGTGIWNAGAFTNGQIKTLDITATIATTGPYANTASLDSLGADDLVASNNSQTVTLTPSPVADLRLTKAVSNAEPAVGTNVTFTIDVTNDGPSDATNVAVSDVLPGGYSFVSSTTVSGAYASGTGVWTIGTIPATNTVTLDIVATVLASGVYDNTAQVSASDQLDPDSTPANNIEAEDDQQTVVVTPPEIGLAKAVSSGPTNNGDGTYTLTYTLLVQNTGATALNNVQISDNLSATFAGATAFVVDSVTSGTLAVNAGFNGAADQNLLVGTDTLAPAASDTVDVQVTVTPGGALGPFNNTATANAASPGGTAVSDTSQDGSNVDPDGDGDPTDNNVPTPVTFAETPEIGTAKDVSAGPTNNGDGTYTLTYTVTVENTGDVRAEQRADRRRSGDHLCRRDGFVVDSVTSGTLAANAGFNGVGDTEPAGRHRHAGDRCQRHGRCDGDGDAGCEPGSVQQHRDWHAAHHRPAPASTDTSHDGTDVDPDGNGDPANNSVPTPVTFAESARDRHGQRRSVPVRPTTVTAPLR